MRLWSLHPAYLDRQGLLAAWREGLLAQKVLEGLTRGYTRHPQLERFRESPEPRALISRFLNAIASEAALRGYAFDTSKIHSDFSNAVITVTRGQVEYERLLLLRKLEQRDKERIAGIPPPDSIELNPVFTRIEGEIASWERIKPEVLE